MASIRAVVVEMEGADATVLDAIRSFVARTNGLATVAALTPAPPARLAIDRGTPALPARRKSAHTLAKAPPLERTPLKRIRRTTPGDPVGFSATDLVETNAEKASKQGKKSGCREQVFEALRHRPMTSSELLCRFPSYTPSSIYLALKELRNAGTVKTHDIDGEVKNERVA